MKRFHPTLALVVAALLLMTAACGQKSGVALSAGAGNGAASTGAAGDSGLGDASATGDTVPAADAGTGATPGAPGTPTAGTGTKTAVTTKPGATAGGTGGATGTGTGGTSGGGAAAAKADRTGIDDATKTITIGIHAPVTGAAPIDQKTFDTGKDIYWKFVKDNGGIIGGYNVKVVFRDDQFSPTVARQKCQEMVENDKVFMLIGAAGADQITSCARYAESINVPYLSAGVNTDGLAGLKNYFAVSMTYAQQAPLLAGLIKNKLAKTRVGLAVLDTPDFVDARKAAIAAVQASGGQIVSDQKIPKTAGTNETNATATNLKNDGADVVYVLTSPTIFINLVKSIHAQVNYDPDMVGPGITNGLNLVAQVACPDAAKAQFLSPFPQLDVIKDLDPDYQVSYNKYVGQNGDDIGLALWGINKVLRQMFEAGATDGKELSRQSFLAGIASGKEFKTNVFPPLKYSASNHFGSTQAHLLAAECTPPNGPRFRTAAQFASAF
ncbi:MAG: branched-chain amino acid transport system substrate-binding protein [Actinomycetota bacterium]|jgi:ABC-type branched-subunit amino acid transport system substrate-binding protein|nr:branched-chain amino acid transport system substrate-binding protein [Actinomycetota bacterium]